MFFKKKKEKINTQTHKPKLSEDRATLTVAKDTEYRVLSKDDKLTWNVSVPTTKESEQLIDKLQLENLNLKNEISYYKRYIKYLEDNYIFILKSLDCAKDIYDTIGEYDEEFN